MKREQNRTVAELEEDIERHIEECSLLILGLRKDPTHYSKNARRCARIAKSTEQLQILYQQRQKIITPKEITKHHWEEDFSPPTKSAQASA